MFMRALRWLFSEGPREQPGDQTKKRTGKTYTSGVDRRTFLKTLPVVAAGTALVVKEARGDLDNPFMTPTVPEKPVGMVGMSSGSCYGGQDSGSYMMFSGSSRPMFPPNIRYR